MTIHGSRPNRGTQRRAGYAIQAYVPTPARQLLGDNLWLPMRGEFMRPDCVELERPGHDMDPIGVESRPKANANWVDILYQSASQKRNIERKRMIRRLRPC